MKREPSPPPSEPVITTYDGHGHTVESLDVGQTLSVGIKNLGKNRTVRVTLRDDSLNTLISYYQLTSNVEGEIEPSVLWYNTGVLDQRTPKNRKTFPFEYRSFQEADEALDNKTLVVSVEFPERNVVRKVPLRVNGLKNSKYPLVYFSTKEGLLRNSYEINKDKEMFLTVRNVQCATNMQVMLVPHQYGWGEGFPLHEVRKSYIEKPQLVRFDTSKEALIIPLGQIDGSMRGSFDVILRIDPRDSRRYLKPTDLISFPSWPGIILQLAYSPPWAPHDFDIAGRRVLGAGLPYFEFHDVFAVGEQMWGAVDPAILPVGHPDGRYGAYYVIPHGTSSTLGDQTEAVEIVPVRSGCINQNITRIWNSSQEGSYDIVVDFGSTTAMTQGDWSADNTFNAGVDFIDRAMTVGAYVLNDPALAGTFATTAYSYQPASTSSSDPLRTDVSSYFNSPDASVTENMNNVPLRAVGYYPNGTGPFPLLLIAHGNHDATHASHTGYDYLCQLLASHGIIAMSIDENFLNGFVSGEMDARAIVLLRHLQRWRAWNSTVGHTFYNKVDMNKIGLSGHSRGGEAITVANLFSTTLHNAGDLNHDFNFNIRSLYAIAPVDGQIGTGAYTGTPVVINNADYFIMHGSHDGDVTVFHGQRTYDRAFPNPSIAGGNKGLLFVYGANHNYWNTEWASHSNDGTRITSTLAQITAIQQQNIGKVYVSAFFQSTLLGKEAYEALLSGDVTFGTIPTGVTMVNQFSDKERVDLNNYEEDVIATTGTYPGVSNSANGLSPFLDADITGSLSWSSANAYYTWNQTRGVIAGWNTTSATYEITLPASIGTLVNTYPYLSLRIGQVYESPASLNPVGANKDLSIQLELGATNTHSLKVSNFDLLPYPVETFRSGFNVTKSNMKAVRIPLRAFTINQASWNLANISKVKLKFDKSPTGRIVLDDVQLTK